MNEPAERVLRVRICGLTVVPPVGKKQFLLNKKGCVKMNIVFQRTKIEYELN